MFSDLLGGVRNAWDKRRELTLDYILEGIGAVDIEIRAHAARLEDMRTAALSRSGAEKLAQLFSHSGLSKITLAELRSQDNQRFWGWELTAETV